MHAYHRFFRALPLAALSCGLLLWPSVATGQNTRAEVIAERQAAKAETLEEERPGRAEEVVTRVGTALMGGPPTGFYPWLGSVVDGSGTAVGAGYRRPLGDRASVTGVAGISVSRSTLLQARAELPRLAGGRISSALVARKVDARDMAFYGTGADSPDDARLRYDYQPASVGLEATARPLPPVVVGVGHERLRLETHLDSASRPPGVEAPSGANQSLHYGVTRVSAALDWRPYAGYSTRGGLVRGSWTRHDEHTGKPYSFDTREFEITQLVPLLREHYVLAFRALATFTDPRQDGEVPFMLAPYLGSSTTLRGFRNRRFVDRQRVLLTGEYRWRPSRYLDMALFVDAGQVADRREAFRFEALSTSVGIGGRLHAPTFNVFRFDVARGREGWAVAISTAQPF